MTLAIVEASRLRKTFTLNEGGSSRLEVLRGIDLEVAEGEMIAIVGASGSGKSTLLHLLGGLDRPSEGSVLWNGRDISKLDDEALASLRGSHAGFVFQFHHLLPEFTALENVMMPLLIQRVRSRDAAARAKEVLASVGLTDRFGHKPGELSGGEQQRVAVARALANRPRIVFADEPTGNLDSVSSAQIHDLLSELNRADRQSFLIVTHDETFAARSNRVFRMVDGLLRA